MKVLSIDAWRYDGSWTWNNWHSVGNIDKADFEKLKTNRQIMKWFRENDYLNSGSKGKIKIVDDGHNIVICAKSNEEPFYAIEYGTEY